MKPEITYILLHIDVNDCNSVLGSTIEGKSLANAIVSLKHHPCTKGEIYSFDELLGFDRKVAKLIATKKDNIIIRHDIEPRQRKEILLPLRSLENIQN